MPDLTPAAQAAEREAFEAWWAGLVPAPWYEGIQEAIARNAWQARAALAAAPAPAYVPMTDEELISLWNSESTSDGVLTLGAALFARAVEAEVLRRVGGNAEVTGNERR